MNKLPSKCPKGRKDCELCKIYTYRNKKYICSGIVMDPKGVPKFDVVRLCSESSLGQISPDEALATIGCLNYTTMMFLIRKFGSYKEWRLMGVKEGKSVKRL